MMVSFIDTNRIELGVEPICAMLQIAPSTYYSFKSRPVSARAARDVVLGAMIKVLFDANYGVYGARKMWKAMRRAGEDIGRDQVANVDNIQRRKLFCHFRADTRCVHNRTFNVQVELPLRCSCRRQNRLGRSSGSLGTDSCGNRGGR